MGALSETRIKLGESVPSGKKQFTQDAIDQEKALQNHYKSTFLAINR